MFFYLNFDFFDIINIFDDIVFFDLFSDIKGIIENG